MVVGESGVGKSTFINTLFLSDVYNSDYPGPTKRYKKTAFVQSQTVILKVIYLFILTVKGKWRALEIEFNRYSWIWRLY